MENDFRNYFYQEFFLSFSSNFKIILQNYHLPLTVSMKTRKHFKGSEYTTRTGYSKTISTYSSVYLFSLWSNLSIPDHSSFKIQKVYPMFMFKLLGEN